MSNLVELIKNPLTTDKIFEIVREIGWYLDPYDISEEDYERAYELLVEDERAFLQTFFESTDVGEVRECLIDSEDDKELADYDLLYDYYQARYCS